MSSETVNDDEDLVLVYLEDDDEVPEGAREIPVPLPITIKVEPLEEGAEKSVSEVFKIHERKSKEIQNVVTVNEDVQLDKEDRQNQVESKDKQDADVITETEKNLFIETAHNDNRIENEAEETQEKLATDLDINITASQGSTEYIQIENTLGDEPSEHCKGESEKEEEFHAEYLDENAIKQELLGLSDEYQVEFLEEELFDNDNISDEEFVLPEYQINPHRTKRKYNKSHGNFVSVAEQLRQKYPELRKDTGKLVKELADIMRQAKPPPPPENFYKVLVESKDKLLYECSFCGKIRSTLPLAARHYQFSHGENYLTCLACGVQHRNTTNLYKHEKRCLAPDGKLVLRARGRYLGRKGRGRPFTTQDKFITANTRHIKEKGQRLFCSKCPASFAHRENLEAHEFSHEGVRPFHCGQCPARYTSAPALRRHYLAMHGDQQFICDHCGASFKLKPLLVSHMNSHRAVRKHPCLYCERRFTQKNALRHHMNTVHLNLPPAHGCPLCPKRYPRMTQVKDHMAKVHGLTMITRRMYYQSLPTLPQEALQVSLEPSLVNYRTHEPEIEQYVKPKIKHKPKQKPTIKQEPDEIISDWPLQEYVELDLRDSKPDDPFISYVVVRDGKATKMKTGVTETDFLKKILGSETEENDQEYEDLETIELEFNIDSQNEDSQNEDSQNEDSHNEESEYEAIDDEYSENQENIADDCIDEQVENEDSKKEEQDTNKNEYNEDSKNEEQETIENIYNEDLNNEEQETIQNEDSQTVEKEIIENVYKDNSKNEEQETIESEDSQTVEKEMIENEYKDNSKNEGQETIESEDSKTVEKEMIENEYKDDSKNEKQETIENEDSQIVVKETVENEEELEYNSQGDEQPTKEKLPEDPPKLRKSLRKKMQLSSPKDNPLGESDQKIEFHGKRAKKEQKIVSYNTRLSKEDTTNNSEASTPADETEQYVEKIIKRALRKRKVVSDAPEMQKKPRPEVNLELQPVMKVSTEDEKDWKEYKKKCKKDEVVAEFLEYMKSKKVPPKQYPVSAPILRSPLRRSTRKVKQSDA